MRGVKWEYVRKYATMSPHGAETRPAKLSGRGESEVVWGWAGKKEATQGRHGAVNGGGGAPAKRERQSYFEGRKEHETSRCRR